MNKNFTVYATICGYLHDIGKSFIPPSILQKQAKLTDKEYEVMKTHTTIGYQMCMKDRKLMPYSAGPLYHHEGLDGSGYPNGYTINDIPYVAQIIRVADEYDAITSKRQYKTHIDISDTLEMLIAKTKPSIDDPKAKIKDIGKMDPKIVKALLKVVKIDIEYEIACVYDYVEHLKNNIKRLEDIKRWHEEMNTFTSQSEIDYYRSYILKTFEPQENFDNYQTILEEYKKAYTAREAKIQLLYKEIKKIKAMKC